MLTATKQVDGLGNRENVNVWDGNDITYTVDDLTNRYTSVADANLTYDAAGSLTKDRQGYEYEYDYENRNVKITKAGQTKAEFAYDALGRKQGDDYYTGNGLKDNILLFLLAFHSLLWYRIVCLQ